MAKDTRAKFFLYRGNTLLGTIIDDPSLEDWPWQSGNFAPAEGFSSVQHLFEQELQLMRASKYKEFDEAWKIIQEPGLKMHLVDTDKIFSVGLLHIDGEKASWRTLRDLTKNPVDSF